ncbi:unnamed protein product [Caenorhabditis angaria]|uniref:Nucleolar protein 6 n=1 Tax=Caenorhabditis angaria TaxID=860376 RepID=A0A9P1I9J9_9PELO|nr:unnamed protein product [Caenorhabditis angaria]
MISRMDIEELFENSANELPMSTGYRLLCEDASNSVKENAKLKTIANTIKSTKLKYGTDYKNFDYWTKLGIKYPLEKYRNGIRNTTSSVAMFTYSTPKSVETSANSIIYVEIPDQIFGNRDYLNLTYAAKRAHYMCAIALLLKNENVEFIAKDSLYPDLLIDNEIRISFWNENIAKNRRFSPNIGNLRPTTIYKSQEYPEDVETPQFNQRFLRTWMEKRLKLEAENILRDKRDVRIALNLVKRFMENRNLVNLSDNVLLARVIRLIKQGEISDKQQILSVIRIIWKDLILWDTNEIEYLEVDETLEDEIEKEYKKHFEVNLVWDYWNITYSIGKFDIDRMKKELIATFPLLGDIYAFDSIFIEKIPIFSQFDNFVRLTVNPSETKHLLSLLGRDSVDDSDIVNGVLKFFIKMIYKTMPERFDYLGIHKIGESELKWSTTKVAQGFNGAQTFLIGFRVNNQWTNPLTIGPPAQNEEAKEFRALWKGVSELRKFADTRICECVVWSNEADEKVALQILQFILQKILSVPGEWLSWRNSSEKNLKSSTNQQQYESVTRAFADLSAILRSLKGIPLMITNVHGISPYIRATEPIFPSIYAAQSAKINNDHVVPEFGEKIPAFTPTVTVHIKLEYSGRWGQDIEAIRRLTSSFYIKIAEKLRDSKLIAVPTIDQIFVMKDGIVFKLVIVHDKVLNILEEKIEELRDSGATRIESSVEGMRLSAWKKRFVTEPLLQLQLQSFSTSHRIFGKTCQIFKKWLGAKLLSGYLDDIIIELLVVAAISKKGNIEAQSAWCAFTQTLHLLASHNWLTRPLIVDFGAKKFGEEERRKLEEDFVKMRPILPPMVLITEEDRVGSKFTKQNPCGIVLKRLVGLANESLKILEKNVVGECAIDLEASLISAIPDYRVYDAIIELETSAVVRRMGILERKNGAKRLPVVEFDPVDELIYQLNNQFSQHVFFFYNKYGGDKIAMKFKPIEEVPAKIGRCNLHKSISDSRILLNKSEIYENIRIIGDGIVSDIQVLRK